MFTKKFMPSISGKELFKGRILHSSEYRTGAIFRNKSVLVVGMGNSGAELTCDLWEQGVVLYDGSTNGPPSPHTT